MLTFKTIRQTAALGILSEYRLRLMVAAGTCPGIYVGNRFLVNVDALIEQLQRMSIEGKTIRQTAALGILSEYRLRLMVAAGTCPGIYVGNRFLVNVDALIEQLQRMSIEGRKND